MDSNTQHSPFDALGGEPGVRKLVDRFYDLMDSVDKAEHIRRMHPDDLTDSRQKLFEFLCGFLGGPSLYIQKHGHPRLRMRHAAFSIDEAARDSWLACMHQALEEQVEDKLMLMQLKNNFFRTAHHLINRESSENV